MTTHEELRARLERLGIDVTNFKRLSPLPSATSARRYSKTAALAGLNLKPGEQLIDHERGVVLDHRGQLIKRIGRRAA
jgi:hypothetical protein